MNKHFTVSVFIIHNKKVLLHLHKKAKKILPLGGHIESNELPEETCMREVFEESGLKVKLYNPVNEELKKSCELSGEKLLINPIHTILGEVEPNHYHVDFIYYATSESSQVSPQTGESKLLKWYSKKDLEESSNIQENILNMAKEALELLCSD